MSLFQHSLPAQAGSCYRCDGQHDPQSYRFINEQCRYCKKRGQRWSAEGSRECKVTTTGCEWHGTTTAGTELVGKDSHHATAQVHVHCDAAMIGTPNIPTLYKTQLVGWQM